MKKKNEKWKRIAITIGHIIVLVIGFVLGFGLTRLFYK